MKNWIFVLLFCQTFIYVNGQDEMKKEMMVAVDSTTECCAQMESKFKNLYGAEFRSYISPMASTRSELSSASYFLDETAIEIGVRFGSFPKIFYFQQLGSLRSGNYVSINGIGLKEKYQFEVFKNSDFIVAPYVEIGAGYYQMNIVNRLNSNSINTVLRDEVNQTKLDNFSVTADLGLSLGYIFNVSKSKFAVAVQGGYMTNLPSPWMVAQSLSFREKADLSSLYFGLRLGLAINDVCCK